MTATRKADTPPNGFSVEMSFDKDTRNTRRFVGDADAFVPTLYIEKTAFGGRLPRNITIVVTWGDES